MKLTSSEERVLAIISQDIEEHSHRSDVPGQGCMALAPAVKVFSFHHDSNSMENPELEFEEGERSGSVNLNESEILEEIKLGGNEAKKKRISEAFSAERKSLGFKKRKIVSEEEQLQELCNSQQEMNNELRSIREILKKCQLSIEKIALLKRAELRLKCAKYGVDFGDLFD